jgi:WD40 repeat protein
VKVWDVAADKPFGQPLPHPARVQSVAYSPDGKSVLTACWDGKARRWDPATGKLIGQPLNHWAAVLTVAFSPDGKTLLTGSADHYARLWDTATGKFRGGLPHAEGVNAVAFSPDGRSILTGCDDHTARLWDAATGQRLGSPMMNRYPVRSVSFHPTKPLLVSGGGLDRPWPVGRGETRLWDATTMKPVGSPGITGGIVHALAFSPDGRSLVTATEDGRARVSDISSLHPLSLTVRHAPDIRWVRFRPDGKAFVTVSAPKERGLWGEMRLWDTANGKPLGPPMPAHSADDDGVGFIVHFSPDGKALFDGFALPREATTGRPLGPHQSEETAKAPRTLFSPDGKQFCVLQGGAVLLWDTATNKQVGTPLAQQGGVSTAAFHPDGKILLTAGGHATTCLWDLTTFRRIGEPLRHDSPVKAVYFAPDGRTFLTADRENVVRQWRTRTGRPVGTVLRVPGDVPFWDFHSMRFTANGKPIVLGAGQMLYLWDAATGRLLTNLPITNRIWGPQRKLLGLLAGDVWVGSQGEVRLWDVEHQQFRGIALPGKVRCLDVHPDGRLVATGDDEMAGLWDVVTGRLVGPPLDHPSQLISLDFAPDGRTLLTCCGDETARLWELPRPVLGSPEHVKLSLEVLTGKALDDAGAARPLTEPELVRRRKRLEELSRPTG